MRIGLVALGSRADQVSAQAQRAEEDGFAALWFTGAVPGDPFVPMTPAPHPPRHRTRPTTAGRS